MNKILFASCLFVGLFLLSSQNVFACSCRNYFTPLVVHYSVADSVFVGKVINVKKIANESKEEAWKENRTVEFEIQKIYKGINSSTKRIILNTHLNSGSCGLDEVPKKGQKWIVFVNKDEGR